MAAGIWIHSSMLTTKACWQVFVVVYRSFSCFRIPPPGFGLKSSWPTSCSYAIQTDYCWTVAWPSYWHFRWPHISMMATCQMMKSIRSPTYWGASNGTLLPDCSRSETNSSCEYRCHFPESLVFRLSSQLHAATFCHRSRYCVVVWHWCYLSAWCSFCHLEASCGVSGRSNEWTSFGGRVFTAGSGSCCAGTRPVTSLRCRLQGRPR